MDERIFTVTAEEDGQRLDKLICLHFPDLTRSAVQKHIENENVFVNDRPVVKSCKPKTGDVICLELPEPQVLDVVAQDIPLDIVYEDDDLLVVNKPKGMVVHPAAGNYDGTLVNALLYHCGDSLSGINGVIRPGIVHRIDKDTSGLLIVAKNDASHQHLAAQIQAHSFKREYRAVVVGRMPQHKGTIDLPLGRSPVDRKKQAVNGLNPRRAVTHYEVMEEYSGYSLCRFTLETGRTHQIRVHCAALGHPVAGDTVYGNPKQTLNLNGQCLHAAVIGFIHPTAKTYLEFSADLPDYFTAFLHKIKQ
ncbi:MAG: RluA family pseudouridine synthase [Clostridia bacterium]|nr:RluA family pseudouridine synthase [Clostridia bacterium]MBR6779725.1 RluA family pseudouridine synthase [Clostridia bacterium]